MSVNFYTDNSFGQYPQLQKDVKDVKGSVKSVETLDKNIGKSIVESVPMFRRVASLPDKLQSDDFIPAVGLASLALINLPEDLKDVSEAYDHAKGIVTSHPYEAKYDHKIAQHDFSFLRGTLIEKWGKNTKNDKVRNTIFKLYQKDVSLSDTSFGEKIKNFLGISEGKDVETSLKNESGDSLWLNEIKSKGVFGDLTARALKRTTLLGVGALALLELPKILGATFKGKDISEQTENTGKQIVKSGVNVTSIIAGIGYGGAFGAKHGGAIGSLVGMGTGAVAGAFASNKIQDLIN